MSKIFEIKGIKIEPSYSKTYATVVIEYEEPRIITEEDDVYTEIYFIPSEDVIACAEGLKRGIEIKPLPGTEVSRDITIPRKKTVKR